MDGITLGHVVDASGTGIAAVATNVAAQPAIEPVEQQESQGPPPDAGALHGIDESAGTRTDAAAYPFQGAWMSEINRTAAATKR